MRRSATRIEVYCNQVAVNLINKSYLKTDMTFSTLFDKYRSNLLHAKLISLSFQYL